MRVLNENSLQLGPNLTKLMRSSGITIKSLSRKLGIAPSTLFNFCSNIMPRNPDHIRLLCEHFNITSDELLFGIRPDKALKVGDTISGTLKVIALKEKQK